MTLSNRSLAGGRRFARLHCGMGLATPGSPAPVQETYNRPPTGPAAWLGGGRWSGPQSMVRLRIERRMSQQDYDAWHNRKIEEAGSGQHLTKYDKIPLTR